MRVYKSRKSSFVHIKLAIGHDENERKCCEEPLIDDK